MYRPGVTGALIMASVPGEAAVYTSSPPSGVRIEIPVYDNGPGRYGERGRCSVDHLGSESERALGRLDSNQD